MFQFSCDLEDTSVTGLPLVVLISNWSTNEMELIGRNGEVHVSPPWLKICLFW